ncbi:MAG: MBOAT family protein [Synechococcus sp.]
MLFNSFIFIFLFLPLTLITYYFLSRKGYFKASLVCLVVASFIFYGYWNQNYLLLLLFSILSNYSISLALDRIDSSKAVERKILLISGITFNLGLIAYYKYAGFLVQTINDVVGTNFNLVNIILPLAISFFTFQQIAYLVDVYQGKVEDHNLLKYCLFVVFFPQLIAGPIIHHNDVMKQFNKNLCKQSLSRNLAIGSTIFFIGLFKKVCLADTIASYANPVFNAAELGGEIGFLDGWEGALAYTFQLYFDFSGYSDMAIGAAGMFGILLPLNFNSPYKSVDISDFWRRWHMTLSRFLRDYIYIPLGGNRKGEQRRKINLMSTMLLGGLWHGAGWTFVLWGGLHGLYLTVHRQWQAYQSRLNHRFVMDDRVVRITCTLLTFISVSVAWVFFRANTLAGATNILKGMFGLYGLGDTQPGAFICICLLAFIVFLAPNTQEWMTTQFAREERYLLSDSKSQIGENPFQFLDRLRWFPDRKWATLVSLMSLVSLLLFNRESEFIYFQF